MQISNKVTKKREPDSDSDQYDGVGDDNTPADPMHSYESQEDDSDKEQFSCLALQHRTKDYLASLVQNPTQVIFVHVSQDDQE